MVKRITIERIAEETNTSIGTVDRALNNRPGINKETKELILKVAEELGYRGKKITGKERRIAVVDYRREANFH